MTDNNGKTKRTFNYGLGAAGNEERTRKPGIHMVCGFAVLATVMIGILISIMMVRFDTVIREQASSVIDMLNVQGSINVDNYMGMVQKNANMVFSNEAYYTYDPTLSLGSADLVTEAKIASDLSIYASLENYQDFCIAYPYGHTVGQLSDVTWGYYGTNLYDEMALLLSDKPERWVCGPGSEFDTFYYLHRVNENAIMIASISSERFLEIVDIDKKTDMLSTYVTDDSLVVLSTTADSAEIGTYLKSGIYRLANKNGGIQVSRLYIVCTRALDCGWYYVSAVPYNEVTGGISSDKLYMWLLGLAMVIVSIIFTIIMTRRIINKVNQTVGKLDVKSQTDLLTGLLNKKSFEEIVDISLGENYDQSGYALVFMDVDNFKGVNDRCGHDVGDDVLRSFSHTISSVFRDDDIKGRLGGDEFCVLMKLPHGATGEEMIAAVNEVCGRFRDALHRKATTSRQSMPAVTSSMGAVISSSSSDNFEELYRRADTALYHSKHKGKDTWSIYGEE